MKLKYYFLLFILATFVTGKTGFTSDNWVLIPGKKITPFLNDNSNGSSNSKEVEVKSFKIAKYATSNLDFNNFIKNNSKWMKKNILKLFADDNYLQHWQGLNFGQLEKHPENDYPVVNVSWFAANAFCSDQGGRLPTTLEWELAADSENQTSIKIIMDWYAKTSNVMIPTISELRPNELGVFGINGVIWEWVEDFNSVMITTDSRNNPDNKVTGLFCGGGSLNAKDSSNYAAFMRFAFRNSLDGRYTNGLLGFRCAKDI